MIVSEEEITTQAVATARSGGWATARGTLQEVLDQLRTDGARKEDVVGFVMEVANTTYTALYWSDTTPNISPSA